MDINNKLVEKVAALLKINASELKESLSSEKEITLPDKVYLQSDVDTLTENIQKEKYESGKTAGVEMLLKDLKKKYTESFGIDLEGIKDYNELITMLIDSKTKSLKSEIEKIKEESGKDKSAKVKSLEAELEKVEADKIALQNQIKDKDIEFDKVKLDMKNSFNFEKANNSIMKQISGLQFTVPKSIENLGEDEITKYLKIQKSNAENLFKNSYKIDFDTEGKEIVIDKTTNEVIKDSLQNNEKIENLIVPFAKKHYLNLQDDQTAGRGSGGKGVKMMFTNLTEDEFFKQAAEKGIKQNTTEFDTLYSEFKKAKN